MTIERRKYPIQFTHNLKYVCPKLWNEYRETFESDWMIRKKFQKMVSNYKDYSPLSSIYLKFDGTWTDKLNNVERTFL